MAKQTPTTRQRQRDATRGRILEAAIQAFTEKGFHGASTRDIARLADTNQGLITYHFSSKEALWRAAANTIFAELAVRLGERLPAQPDADPREYAREIIREYVRFVSERPELFRLMVDEGKVADERMEWLVDTHIQPYFDTLAPQLKAIAGLAPEMVPHAFYTLTGAASLIFAVAPECRRLTGLDPNTAEAVARHADYLANLMVPPAGA